LRNENPVRGGRRRRGRWRVLSFVLLGFVALAACVIPWTLPTPTGYQRVETANRPGKAIGAEQCYACHASFDTHRVSTEYHADCESCHGPGQMHNYTAKPQDIRYPANADCEACHQTGRRTLQGWTTSGHARNGVLCSDCHDTHNQEPEHVRLATRIEGERLRDAGNTTQMCSACHPEVAAQLDLPSHHPVREGMIGCTDCHKPHEGRKQTLGARTQVCTSCHQEVNGPWIYEHAPVTENCGYCHTPHGASADNLLAVSEPGGCISCHSLATAGAAHDPWAFTTRCTDCHSAVHGSYTDPHLRR
jgi:DmsE family decaheme c-type cytochrome